MYCSYLWKYFTLIFTEMFISRTLVSTPVAAPAGRVAIEVDKRILEVGKVVMTGQKVAITGKEEEWTQLHEIYKYMRTSMCVICLPSSILFVTVTCSHNGTTDAWDPIADNQRKVPEIVMSTTNIAIVYSDSIENHCHSLGNIEFVH